MRLLKQYPLLRLVNSYVVDSPQPANISYVWNFGSLLATVLGLQIVTGVLLAMHYTPSVDLAFVSVEHIMRDVNYGWLIRYLHANGASFFFIFVYAHIGRNLYYGSYLAPRTMPWSVGVIMLILIIGILVLVLSRSSGDLTQDLSALIIYAVVPVGVLVPKRVLASQRIGPYPYDLICLIVGGMLGDMTAHSIPGRDIPSVRFSLEQGAINSGYLMYCFSQFYSMGYASVPPIFVGKDCWRFYLHTYTSLHWIYEGFYTIESDKRVKVLPTWLELYFTPLCVAHWFQQDGNRQIGQGVYFATNCFTYAECERLAGLLRNLYGLKTSVVSGGKPNQWRVSVWKQSMPAFATLVRPYMHRDILYKLEGYLCEIAIQPVKTVNVMH